MERKYLSFDIESAKLWPEGEHDWRVHRPLGICCAATLPQDGNPVLWYNSNDRLDRDDAAKLVDYLTSQVDAGYTITTWNGTGFDFDVLAEESGLLAECRHLASTHVDMMFHILCRLGYGGGLDAAAKGMGLPGKPEGMTGAKAPTLWLEGRHDEVLDYVTQDVRTTLELATTCETVGHLCWIARSGKTRRMALPTGWFTVTDAEILPLPNTSWMAEPWSRSTFTGWLRERQKEPFLEGLS